ncbi:hypothetical protein BD779DRAFT_1494834, partial [Infundibulicybe gibba]
MFQVGGYMLIFSLCIIDAGFGDVNAPGPMSVCHLLFPVFFFSALIKAGRVHMMRPIMSKCFVFVTPPGIINPASILAIDALPDLIYPSLCLWIS